MIMPHQIGHERIDHVLVNSNMQHGGYHYTINNYSSLVEAESLR